MKLKAKIVNPDLRKSKISCFGCDLSYNSKEYKILYENEKLAFFKMSLPKKRSKIYCHGCLYKEIYSQMGYLKEMSLEMELVGHKVNLLFYK